MNHIQTAESTRTPGVVSSLKQLGAINQFTYFLQSEHAYNQLAEKNKELSRRRTRSGADWPVLLLLISTLSDRINKLRTPFKTLPSPGLD